MFCTWSRMILVAVVVGLVVAPVVGCGGKAGEEGAETGVQGGAPSDQEAGVEQGDESVPAPAGDDDEQVSMQMGEGGLQIKTPDGELNIGEQMLEGVFGGKNSGMKMTAGESAVIPEGFPKEVPIYPGLDLKMAMENQEKATYHVQGHSADAMEKVRDYYKDKLDSAGWKEGATFNAPGERGMNMMNYQKGDLSVSMVFTQRDGGTDVILTVGSSSQ
jgi:hypothetical protein